MKIFNQLKEESLRVPNEKMWKNLMKETLQKQIEE